MSNCKIPAHYAKGLIIPELVRLIVIDSFCGAGGFTTGVENALDRLGRRIAVVVAGINHDKDALKSHAENHPETVHFVEDVRDKSLPKRIAEVVRQARKLYPNAKVLFHASLECTNFSNAKGGKSRDADSRSLAEFMPAYLMAIKPDYFTIENVREFMAWGPMIAKVNKKHTFEGHKAPCCQMVFDKKKKEWDYHWIPEHRTKGQDYQRWIREIGDLGYQFDSKLLNAADFGAYTSRLRYFAIFAKSSVRISWPEPTHAKVPLKVQGQLSVFDNLQRWKAVRDVLDFSDEGHSIFGRKTNMALRKQDRKDLVEKSLERIYAGLVKHVAGGADSFLSKYYSGNPDQKNISLDGPAGSLTTVDSHAYVKASFIVQRQNDVEGRDPAGRTVSIDGPARTITTSGGNQELVQAAFLYKYISNSPLTGTNAGSSINEPCVTITTQDRIGLVNAAFLSKYYGDKPESRNTSLNEPCGTLTTENRCALVKANFLANYYSSGGQTASVDDPSPTLPTKDRLSLVVAEHFVDQQYGNSKPASVDDPAGTLTENPKLNLVRAERYMVNYYSGGGDTQNLEEPTTALTTIPKQRLITLTPVEGFVYNPGWFGHSAALDQPAPVVVARQDKAPLSVVKCERMLMTNLHSNVPKSLDEPAPALLTGTHHYLLNAQYDNGLRTVDQVAPTITADRHYPYLVVTSSGELAIEVYKTDSPATVKIKRLMAELGIVDIKMRMLNVPELKRIQGFPDGYVLKGGTTKQKKFIGNAVVPQVVQRMIEALGDTIKLKSGIF
ncbi:DNA cytosine methyltransferase [Fibrella forsythiae]|uniref:DNA (cytosine-5-)-methyltransferase n=1 Tax=Fibrella forsythiae TaxID=2817061 RepID=A0ABS3JBH8_9BACT|nr:DNA cytosine methyltransferase [Fibrella forsythiae]MBO0947334.1 DNA cytosine methyltransferase [Fibrella forsythiae]